MPGSTATARQTQSLFVPLDLLELQFDGRRTPEDRHRHLHAAAIVIDLLDRAVEAGERAVQHLHAVADLEVDLQLRLGRSGRLLVARVRSEERRGGKGRGRTCRIRWWP